MDFSSSLRYSVFSKSTLISTVVTENHWGTWLGSVVREGFWKSNCRTRLFLCPNGSTGNDARFICHSYSVPVSLNTTAGLLENIDTSKGLEQMSLFVFIILLVLLAVGISTLITHLIKYLDSSASTESFLLNVSLVVTSTNWARSACLTSITDRKDFN